MAKRRAKKKRAVKPTRKNARRARRTRRRVNPATLLLRGNPDKSPPRRASRRSRRATSRRSTARPAARQPRRRVSTAIDPRVVAFTKKKKATLAELLELGRQVPEFGRVIARHKKFHGTYPANVELVDADAKDPGFRYAMIVGDARAVEYSVPADSARAGLPFRHAFARKRQVVATDASGRHVVLLRRRGSRMRVTERGIMG